jgi:hypothetical protein
MNIEEFPEEIKKDIEDRSLDLLDRLKESLIENGLKGSTDTRR